MWDRVIIRSTKKRNTYEKSNTALNSYSRVEQDTAVLRVLQMLVYLMLLRLVKYKQKYGFCREDVLVQRRNETGRKT